MEVMMSNQGRCYVVGAGDFYGFDTVLKPEDYVIAADAGLRYLENEKMIANLVIGDFDTLGEVPKHQNVIALSCEKDDTDTLSAVKEGIKLGYDVFLLYGCTGGRIEHTLANIQTLKYLSTQGKSGFLFDEDCIMTAITNDKISFSAHEDGYISIFSLTDKSEGVSLKGLKYELSKYTLISDHPIGVSNEFAGRQSTIEVEEGTLLVVFPRAYKEDVLS